MRILVIEDEKRISEHLARGLQQDGYVVDTVARGGDGAQLAARGCYDLVILDLMLPDVGGYDVLKRIKAADGSPAVIILSAKASVENRVKGLELGADDYLVKPYSFSELRLRIRAVMRRVLPVAQEEATTVRVASWVFDRVKRQVYSEGSAADLTPREFMLLDFFLQNRGCPITKRLIFEHVWNLSADPQTNVVDVLVCRLRDKLKDAEGHSPIRTVRGLGYVLEEEQPVAR